MTGNIQKRGNRWYFRRNVPKDLQAHYGKTTLLVALGTSDYETAKPRAAALTVQTNKEFAELRGVKPDSWQAPTSFYLSRDELENAEGLARELAAHGDYHKAVDEGLKQARSATDTVLDAAGLPTAAQLATLQATGGYYSDDLPSPEKARKAAGLSVFSPSQGQANAAPRPNQSRADMIRLRASLRESGVKTLRDVVPTWIKRNAPKDRARGHTDRALELFEQALGLIPLHDLTKAHGVAFVEFLLDTEARGFTRKTAANHAACITALLNVAAKADLIERNPMDLSFDKTIGAQQRTPWTDAELKTVFSSALFSDQMESLPRWMSVAHEDARAALLLVLHTGVRIGEIGQLRRQDFFTRGEITAIRITAEAGTIKTQESERDVPLAAHLLADPWFSDWLAGVMDGTRPDSPALPSVNGRKADNPSDVLTKWFKAFRAYLSLPSGRLYGTHKFRHWIRSALAAKDVGDATADSITGHAAQGSSGRKVYTAAASLPVMLEALNRLAYPKISH